ncbi:MAG: cysteinyl-tRNA synthetase [Gammaproteobacteria bacterium]|jgi:cysteinyl-tRNA synthetase|nr:cysteinyl-tRNA synthetase [Gammaproteobacteria bacterium]
MIVIYDTLTKQKRPFEPLEKGKIKMYVCGMTVYDYCHIGHARVMVAFDVILRYLRFKGYEVTYVRNITDIDDKIIARAKEQHQTVFELTKRFIDALQEDEKKLKVLPPTSAPRATDWISSMIQMITTLIEKGHAYLSSTGDVNYAVQTFKEYGKLSHKHLEDLQAGARVDVNEEKRSPLDFVLWKQAKPDEPAWLSPWGEGRPGWHIECSAMSTAELGEHIDIHGGGFDLQFPHHENEIAQTEAATGKPFVNTWMHVGFVNVNEEKMSKSLGNFFTIRDVLTVYPAEVVRYFLLSSHYRSPINYSTETLNNAKAALSRLYLALRDLNIRLSSKPAGDYESRFTDKMDDDFNTPEALAVLFELAREINQAKSEGKTAQAETLASELKRLGALLGLLEQDPAAFLQGEVKGLSSDEIEHLIQERHLARDAKEWSRADAIRTQLSDGGVILEDKDGKTTWRRQ